MPEFKHEFNLTADKQLVFPTSQILVLLFIHSKTKVWCNIIKNKVTGPS